MTAIERLIGKLRRHIIEVILPDAKGRELLLDEMAKIALIDFIIDDLIPEAIKEAADAEN